MILLQVTNDLFSLKFRLSCAPIDYAKIILILRDPADQPRDDFLMTEFSFKYRSNNMT